MSNVLVVGDGGREYALAWKLNREGHNVHVAPGSGSGDTQFRRDIGLDALEGD